MGQTVLSLIPVFYECLKEKKVLIKLLKQGSHGSNHIVLWSKFARKTGKCEAIEKNYYIKDNMGQIVLPLAQVLKCIWNKNWNFIKTLYGQYGSNRIVRTISWSEFARNNGKFYIDRTIWDFDKEWSNFNKWTICINPYCSQLKNFKKYFK